MVEAGCGLHPCSFPRCLLAGALFHVPGIEAQPPMFVDDSPEKFVGAQDASEFMSRHYSFTSLVSAHHYYCRRRSFISSFSFCLSPYHLSDN